MAMRCCLSSSRCSRKGTCTLLTSAFVMLDIGAVMYYISTPSKEDAHRGGPFAEDVGSMIQYGTTIYSPAGMMYDHDSAGTSVQLESSGWHPAAQQPRALSARAQFIQSARPPLVTVFSAECSTYHDWQTVTLYETWKKASMPGDIVRLLACSADKLSEYQRIDTLGEQLLTHVHDNQEQVTEDGVFPPLNKPYGLLSWLSEGKGSKLPDDTVILIVDPDFSFRSDGVPAQLAPIIAAVRNGLADAVGVDYEYVTKGFKATGWLLPKTFNTSINVHQLQSIGPPMIITKEKLSRLVQGWFSITQSIAQDPELHAQVSDGDQPAPWIADMCGYSIAAAGWLDHQTQLQWAQLEVPQPPFPKTGEGIPNARPIMLHYSHAFSLCGKRFGKKFLDEVDLLSCNEHYAETEKFTPPMPDELHNDNCQCCFSEGDVFGFEPSCFGPDDNEQIVKEISWEAWSRIFESVMLWRSKNCVETFVT